MKRNMALLIILTLLIGGCTKEETVEDVGLLEEVKMNEIIYKDIINTDDLKVTYIDTGEYKVVEDRNEYVFNFDIENYQSYPLQVELEGVTLDGLENYTVEYHGEVNPADTKGNKEGKGYLMLTIKQKDKQPFTGVAENLSFNISFQSKYNEFFKKYSIDMDFIGQTKPLD